MKHLAILDKDANVLDAKIWILFGVVLHAGNYFVLREKKDWTYSLIHVLGTYQELNILTQHVEL